MEVGEENPYCFFHPKVRIVGVCARCLRERLLILASEQGQHALPEKTHKSLSFRNASVSLPRVFALGSLLHRLEFRQRKSHSFHHDTSTSTSHEDSFISIKIEDKGRGPWDCDENDIVRMPSAHEGTSTKGVKVGKSVVEHMNSKRSKSLRWRKRIAYLLQLVRWRRSGKAEGSKRRRKRRGWMSAFTKSRSIE